jgi:methanogenic corrinoid protein MtbC1
VELVVECFDGVGVRPWLHVGAGGAQVCGESGEEVGFGGYVTEDTRCLVDVSSEYMRAVLSGVFPILLTPI